MSLEIFLSYREVSNILLDTVVLEGSVLVHLLNSIVIQTFLPLLLKLDLPGKQPRFPHPFQSVCPIQKDSSKRNLP